MSIDEYDEFDMKLTQAGALAAVMYGSSGAAFRNLGGDVQDRVCWLLAQTLKEAQEALRRYDEAERAERMTVKSTRA